MENWSNLYNIVGAIHRLQHVCSIAGLSSPLAIVFDEKDARVIEALISADLAKTGRIALGAKKPTALLGVEISVKAKEILE